MYFVPQRNYSQRAQKKHVGIYCRVSSKHSEQLLSLSHQVSQYTRIVMQREDWILEDIYIDIKSGETANDRVEFLRLLQDCRSRKIDLVVTRSISRFGRDTLELLSAIRELRNLGVGVMFNEENILTTETDSELIATVIEAFAQAENESKSDNTKIGLAMKAKNGSLGLYNRRCFGYVTDENGKLQIEESEAEIVRSIFAMYLAGESLVGIIHNLEAKEIKTPTGKPKWGKNALDKLLSNEKYCGNVIIFKTYAEVEYFPMKVKKRKENNGERAQYISEFNHPAVISKDIFDAVQAEKERRSNVEIVDGVAVRRAKRYSKKRDQALLV